jgi:AcrR family transcriptional regulator
MPSQRHTVDAILDAARECVLAVGIRRTTLTDVARRAGVSRMTLYRRYPDVRSLVADLMTREFGELLAAENRRSVEVHNTRELLVAHIVAAVAALRVNPLLRKVLDVDPELLLPYVTDRLGSTQRGAEAYLVEQLRAGHEDGSVRRGDVRAQARTLLLAIQPHVLSHRAATEDVDGDVLDGELALLLDSYLCPGSP